MEEVRYCPKCGTPCGDARFCPTCGASVGAAPAPAAPAQQVSFFKRFSLSQWITVGIAVTQVLLLACFNWVGVRFSLIGYGLWSSFFHLAGTKGYGVLLVFAWLLALLAVACYVFTVLKTFLGKKLKFLKIKTSLLFLAGNAAAILLFLFSLIAVIGLNAFYSELSAVYSISLFYLTAASVITLILALSGVALKIPAVQALLKKARK